MKNYQLEMERELTGLGGKRPSLMLHSCCGPCSAYVLECLSGYFDVNVLFFNPNIQPEEEYEKRLANLKTVIEKFPEIRLAACEYSPETFINITSGLEAEPEGGKRCEACIRLRLEKTAEMAEQLGCDYFCSTLTVSPQKNAELINRLGEEISSKFKVRWLYSDFKKRDGYKRSCELSNRWGIYRQDYCGCLFSKRR